MKKIISLCLLLSLCWAPLYAGTSSGLATGMAVGMLLASNSTEDEESSHDFLTEVPKRVFTICNSGCEGNELWEKGVLCGTLEAYQVLPDEYTRVLWHHGEPVKLLVFKKKP